MKTNTRNVRNLLIWSLALVLVASLALIETSARAGHAGLGRHGATGAGEEWGGEEGGGEEWDGEEIYGVAGIPVGVMLARPPVAATPVVIDGTTYWLYQDTYYVRAYSGGDVVYRVVPAPR